MRYKKSLIGLYLLSIATYGASFLLDAAQIKERRTLSASVAFEFGLSSANLYEDGINLIFFAAWLANVAFWIGLALFILRRDRGALLAAEGAVFLAYPLLGLWIWVRIWGESYFALQAGFFVWFTSMLLLAVAARYRLYFERRKRIVQPNANTPVCV
jgi:hypothetical protein